MKYSALFLLLLIPFGTVLAAPGDNNGIPPTKAFQIIYNGTGSNVTAHNYNDDVTFIGQSGISIITDWFTNTVTFAFGGMGGGDCSTVGNWLDSFNYTSENFDCDLAPFGSGGGGGENNTASNLNPGTGIFGSKVGVDLRFKSLLEGNRIDYVSNSTNITILTTAENNTASNVGTNGLGIFNQKTGENLEFKKLIAGDGIYLDSNSTNIIINATASLDSIHNIGNVTSTGCALNQVLKVNSTGYWVCANDTGEANTASNLNPGTGIFNSKVGVDLQFKSLLAGNGVTLSNNSTNITINATGSGEVNTASNVGTSGTGVFKQKTGVDLEFKKLIGVGSTVITSNSTNVIINSTGGAGDNLGNHIATQDLLMGGNRINNTSQINVIFDGSVDYPTLNLTASTDPYIEIVGMAYDSNNDLVQMGLFSWFISNNTASNIDSNVMLTAFSNSMQVVPLIYEGATKITHVGAELNASIVTVKGTLKLKDFSGDGSDHYQIETGELTSDRIISLPVITIDDTFILTNLAQTFGDGFKQTFNPSNTNAGLNLGSNDAEPSAPTDGDIFYDGDGDQVKARVNGAWIDLGATGSGGALDDVLLEGIEISNSRSNLNFNDTSVINFNVQDTVSLDSANVTATIVTGSIGDTQLGNNLDATQIADGTVTSSEFQFINTLTSNAQTQIDGKQTTVLTDGNILVGSAGNVATSVNPTGDVDISNTGVFSIANIHSIGNVTSAGCILNEILKVNSTGYWDCSIDDISVGGITSLNGDFTGSQYLYGETNRININHNMAGSHNFTLGTDVVLNNQANTYTNGNLQSFTDDDIRIEDNTGGQYYTFSTGNISADRVVSFPVLAANDIFSFLGTAQTFTAAKTFNDLTLLQRNPADTFSYTIKGGAITADRQITLPLTTQTETLAVQPQKLSSAVTNPTGTTNTSGLMAGIGSTCTITPRVTGNVFIIVTGQGSTSTGDAGWGADLRYGTGTAPANAAALSGTVLQLVLTGSAPTTTSVTTPLTAPITLQGIGTGLTVGTAYWIDIGQRAVTAGTASFTNLQCTAFEM